MTIELDHLFICSQMNAPEIEQLLDLGLVEGRSNAHPGQGTANRCIFFENFMLELLFAIDDREISSPIKKVQAQSFNHPVGIDRVTKVRITIPSSQSLSEAIKHIHDAQGAVEFVSGTDNLVEIEFDSQTALQHNPATRKQEKDFRPSLPLIFRW